MAKKQSAVRTPQSATACTLELRVIPNAPRDEIAGWLGDALKVKIHAPALEGRANDALLDFVARELGLARRDVTLVHGEKARRKVLRLTGLDEAALRAKLAAHGTRRAAGAEEK